MARVAARCRNRSSQRSDGPGGLHDPRAVPFMGPSGGETQPALSPSVRADRRYGTILHCQGSDTKFGVHMVRLGVHGMELLETGRITLPIPEPWLAWLVSCGWGGIDSRGSPRRGSGDDRTRTDDPLLAKQVLYQLSYVPMLTCGKTFLP